MTVFITGDEVATALEKSTIAPLETAGIPFAVSPDFRFAIYVLNHKAWHIDNEGWRSMHAPPSDDEGRKKLWVIYLPEESGLRSTGFEVFIPLAEPILSLSSSAVAFEIQTSKRLGQLSYDRLPGLHWELITGHAQPEKDIEASFSKLFLVDQ